MIEVIVKVNGERVARWTAQNIGGGEVHGNYQSEWNERGGEKRKARLIAIPRYMSPIRFVRDALNAINDWQFIPGMMADKTRVDS
jgi:hypothetical protein